MEVKASIKNLNIAPKKVRLVAGLVRGKKVEDALDQLRFLNKKSAQSIADLIRTGVANAEHNFKLSADNLMIKELRVDKGMTLKRWTPRAFGRATTINKIMSHVNLVLAEVQPTSSTKKATKEEAAPAEVKKAPAKKTTAQASKTQKAASAKKAPAKKATAKTTKKK